MYGSVWAANRKKELQKKAYEKYADEEGVIPEEKLNSYFNEMDNIEGQYESYLDALEEKDW